MKKPFTISYIVLLIVTIILLRYKIHPVFYILLLIVFGVIIWKNKEEIISYYKVVLKKVKKIKNLDYYYITDIKKEHDIKKRSEVFSFLKVNLRINILVINFLVVFIIPFIYFFNNSVIFSIFTLFSYILFVVVILNFGISIVNRFPSVIFILMPALAYGIYFGSLNFSGEYQSIYLKLIVYLIIAILICSFIVFTSPMYTLRRIYKKALVITSLFTITTIFFREFILNYFFNYINSNSGLLTGELIEKIKEISNNSSLFTENTLIMSILEGFKGIENISFIILIGNIVYLIATLIIHLRVSINKRKAKEEYMNIIINEDTIKYKDLVSCAYKGGGEYENLLLSNEKTRNIIMNNEKNI